MSKETEGEQVVTAVGHVSVNEPKVLDVWLHDANPSLLVIGIDGREFVARLIDLEYAIARLKKPDA